MPATRSHSRLRRFAAVSLAVCGVSLVAWFALRKAATPNPLAERRSDQLVLRDGLLLDGESGPPFSGVVVDLYPEGGRMSRTPVSTGQPDGLSEGWFTNGVKQVEERFVGGVSHGLRTKWHPNGEKASEATIVEGRIEGVFRRWDTNGYLAEEITMQGGVPHGPARAYYASGYLKASAEMAEGQVVRQRFWNDREQAADSPLLVASTPASNR
jgi:antitoxin component YwqK of YwqJK toxin-antitoxin module